MDSLVMVQQLEVKDEEAENERKYKYEEKNPFKGKNRFDLRDKTSGLLHAAPSTL
jgi:hypothetical protein